MPESEMQTRMTTGKETSTIELFVRLLHEWRSFWPHMLGVWLLSLLSIPLTLLAPVALKIAIDSYIGGEPLPDFIIVCLPESVHSISIAALYASIGLALVVAILTQTQRLASSALSAYTSEKLVLGFRTRLFPHVQRLALSYHDAKGSSDSTYRILYDTMVVPSILLDGFIPLITAILTMIAMIIVVFLLSWPLALVAISIVPLLALLAGPFNRRLRTLWHRAKEMDSAALSLLQEVLSAVRVVKAFGKEEREQERLVYIATKGVRTRLRVTFTKGVLDFMVAIIVAIAMAAVIFIGMRQVATGALMLGNLLVIIAYLGQLYGPMQVIVSQAANLQSSFSSAERALELLDEVPEVQERPHARALRRAKGAITCEHVSFTYGSGQRVLDDFSFSMAAGERLGLAGKTGSGKTTLMNLLTRLYDPSEGRLLLDGVDLRDYRLADLRNQFAVVLQDPVLFSNSIVENIAYSVPGASEKDIIRAAKMANAHDFILRLPQGYRTEVGERGIRLSGGERQRISLARAFLKDAPLLILDEPTSSVDMHTEATIMEAIERLMENRTVFIIAHRLSTLSFCDRVLVIRNGKVALLADPGSPAVRETIMMDDVEDMGAHDVAAEDVPQDATPLGS
jgi:ATP-binding cassette subfamily B protein